jgi:DNA-binding transcriptional regulator YhcF (GntR family)
LAADLGINLNTVARAYRELTEAGLLASVRGRGTTVIATVAKATGEPGADPNRIESRLVAALRDAKLAGWDCAAVQTLVALHIERLWKPV